MAKTSGPDAPVRERSGRVLDTGSAMPAVPPLLATRFTATVAVLFILLGAAQLTASLFFYHAIDRQALRDDHARRIAELLVVSDRLYATAPQGLSAAMTTRYLSASVADAAVSRVSDADGTAAEIGRKIVSWEPGLAHRSLRVSVDPAGRDRHDLVGSIRLVDGRWLNFRSRDVAAPWPVASRAVAITLASGAAGLLVGLFVLHMLGRPLRRLAAAAEAIGHGRAVAIREDGTRDLRELAHAMNTMQSRIGRLLRDQAKSFEAISHDLRTPLARQKLAADMVEDAELAAILHQSVNEMEALLASLQQFLRAQHLMADPEPVDLVELVRGVAAPWADRVTIRPDAPTHTTTVVEPLRLALAALVENAVQFGQRATITVACPRPGACTVTVEDEGPGIDPAHFEDVLDPFFRLDEARARDTGGFGLGIPTAHLLMTRFDGRMAFAKSARGGLSVRLDVPRA